MSPLGRAQLADAFLYPVYRRIFTLAHGYWTFPFLLASLAAQQGAQVVGSYALVWWENDSFNKPSGFCMFCPLALSLF